MKRALTFVLALALTWPAAATAAPDDFNRLFPDLPPARYSDQDLADLAQSMEDPNNVSENNCTVTTPLASEGCSFSIMTYAGGQFLDHDVTLDRTPSPTVDIDPVGLTNFRTFRLDLDSVYGGGPKESPQLYSTDKVHFLVQEPNVNGVRDLPRNPDGSAVLVETRNDENQIIAQFHVAVMKAHNAFVDEILAGRGETPADDVTEGDGYTVDPADPAPVKHAKRVFRRAQVALQRHYQLAVINELSAHTLSPSLGPTPFENPLVKRLAKRQKKFTPIEFSAAAFRYGHSNVRLAYRLNGNGNCANLQVFSLTAPDASLMGGRPLQAGRQIDWGMFTDEFPKPAGCENNDRNIQRKFDALISSSLFRLPNPFVSNRSNVLGFLNLVRGSHYGLPSGQAVAAELGLPVLTDDEIGLSPDLRARFAGALPLWFYILRESSVRENGQRLGPVGSTIVAASFKAMLENDPNSVLNRKKWVPRADIVGSDGLMTFGDLIRFAGAIR